MSLFLSSEQIEREKLDMIGANYWYLASPYSKYPDGMHAAWKGVSQLSAALVLARVPHFCPIAWSHPVAQFGGISPVDHEFWLPMDKPLMEHAYGLLVAKMRSWESSAGVVEEIRFFAAKERPIVYLDVTEVP